MANGLVGEQHIANLIRSMQALERRIKTLENRVNAFSLTSGTGTPQGAVTANVGAMYQRTDGGGATTLYVKESGANTNTGWVAK